jgi:poly(A) polymerase
LSNRERKRLVAMTALAPVLSTLSDTQTTHKLIHEFGNEAVADAGILAWAARLAEHGRLNPDETAARRAQLEISSAWTPPTFPVGGDDARALGIAPGPDIGIALRSVEDWWSDGDFQADRDACLLLLKNTQEDQT